MRPAPLSRPPGPAAPAAPVPDNGRGSKGVFDIREGTTQAQEKAHANRVGSAEAKAPVRALAKAARPAGGHRHRPADRHPASGQPARRPADRPQRGAAGAIVALGYVRAHAGVFGLSATDLAGLALARDYVDIEGIHHLSFAQSVGGVTLFGNGLEGQRDQGRPADQRHRLAGARPARAAPRRAPALASVDAAIRRGQAGRRREAASRPAKGDTGQARCCSRPPAAPGAPGRPSRCRADQPDAGRHRRARPGACSTATPLGSDARRRRQSGTAELAGRARTGRRLRLLPGRPGQRRHGRTRSASTASGWLPTGAGRAVRQQRAHLQRRQRQQRGRLDRGDQPTGASGYRFPLVARPRVAGEPCTAYVCTWDPNTRVLVAGQRRRARATQNFYFINNWHDYLAEGADRLHRGGRQLPAGQRQRPGQGRRPGPRRVAGRRDAATTGCRTATTSTTPTSTPRRTASRRRCRCSCSTQPGTTLQAGPVHRRHGLGRGRHRLPRVHPRPLPPAGRRRRQQPGAGLGPGRRRWARPGATGTRWTTWSTRATIKDTEQARRHHRGSLRRRRHRASAARPTDCPVGLARRGLPRHHGHRRRAATPTATSAASTTRRATCTPPARSGRRRCGTCAARSGRKLRRVAGDPRHGAVADLPVATWTCATRILQADQAIHGGEHAKKIWTVFATRGMGFFAGTVSGDDLHPVEDFSTPPPARHPARHADRHRHRPGRPAPRSRARPSPSADTTPASPATTRPRPTPAAATPSPASSPAPTPTSSSAAPATTRS